MSRCRRARIIAAFLLSGAALHAQQPATGSIRGVVQDREFSAPLPGVQVSIVEIDRKSVTTESGSYVLPDLPAGSYTLVFAKDGYVRQVRTGVTVVAGRLTDVDLAMPGAITEMPEFIVQDPLQLGAGTEASLLELRFQSPALLDSIGAEWLSRAGASDAAEALRLVSGATLQDRKTAVVRGLPDRYVSTQLNGLRLPSADEDKRAVELDQFPAAVIESVRVSKTFTPDQQGDASGGAVDLRLKGIPDQPFFVQFRLQSGINSQVAGRSDFLSYEGGGLPHWGQDHGARGIQYQNLGGNWEGSVGVDEIQAPYLDTKWSAAAGGKHVFGDGVKLGGYGSVFYERDSSFYDGGFDDQYWVEKPRAKMTPKTFQGTVQEGDFKTALYDVTRGAQTVQWGTLGTLGLEAGDHALTLVYLYTRTAEDSATLAEDTRGKQYFFPGHDPDDPKSPGHEESDAAPYTRLETLEYTERTTDSLQLHGRHRIPDRLWLFDGAKLDWSAALSSADLYQPDKRQFGSIWYPAREVGPIKIPPIHRGYKPAANFTLGNLQRIWKEIEEDSEQFAANVELPFAESDAGYVKFGWFRDRVGRRFDQETFSNFNDNSSFEGPWQQRWSGVFKFQDHPVTDSKFDVDYDGNLEVAAYYGMLDVPVTDALSLIGGARFESTKIGIVNYGEENATWFPPGTLAPTKLNPGDADVSFDDDEVLPAVTLVFEPFEPLTLRASYSRTIARQTFKELTPVIQQEYLGGPVFIGNPDLKTSSLTNWDLRADYTPYEGGLLSASWFRKDIEDPIEYVQRIGTFDFTTAVNYPRGRLTGWEVEMRHSLGAFWEPLQGFSVGGNATFIDSEVTLPADEAAGFDQPNIQAPMSSRDMTLAPEHVYNLYLTLDVERTGTQASLFYTVQGDTLLAGATQSKGNFVPSVYAKSFDTLNFGLTQKLGEWFKLGFSAKNLTNPKIQTVYRSEYIGDDRLKTSHSEGIDYAISIGGEYRF